MSNNTAATTRRKGNRWVLSSIVFHVVGCLIWGAHITSEKRSGERERERERARESERERDRESERSCRPLTFNAVYSYANETGKGEKRIDVRLDVQE